MRQVPSLKCISEEAFVTQNSNHVIQYAILSAENWRNLSSRKISRQPTPLCQIACRKRSAKYVCCPSWVYRASLSAFRVDFIDIQPRMSILSVTFLFRMLRSFACSDFSESGSLYYGYFLRLVLQRSWHSSDALYCKVRCRIVLKNETSPTHPNNPNLVDRDTHQPRLNVPSIVPSLARSLVCSHQSEKDTLDLLSLAASPADTNRLWLRHISLCSEVRPICRNFDLQISSHPPDFVLRKMKENCHARTHQKN